LEHFTTKLVVAALQHDGALFQQRVSFLAYLAEICTHTDAGQVCFAHPNALTSTHVGFVMLHALLDYNQAHKKC
jgi:hypothetical protein